MEFNRSETFSNWEQWKKALAKTVSAAETVGMSEKNIDKIALRIGNILAEKVDPENREQRLLQELWLAGGEKDRSVLARLIVDIIKNDVRH